MGVGDTSGLVKWWIAQCQQRLRARAPASRRGFLDFRSPDPILSLTVCLLGQCYG